MTLEEAITILISRDCPNEDSLFKGYASAVKLGIEALKLIKRNRRYTPQPYNVKLPGETQE